VKVLLKGVLVFGVVIAFLGGGFSLYAHFLMDYSLESLAFAVDVTQNESASEKMSPLAQQVYQGIVQDLTVQEAAQENVDFKNLVLLDLASRSFEEVEGRAGYSRAKVYLNQIAESKAPARHPVLMTLDSVVRSIIKAFQSVSGFFMNAVNRGGDKTEGEKVELGNYAATLLLNRARENEQQGNLDAAAMDFRKFLQLYGTGPDSGLVSLSLANILIKQRKYPEASKLLDQLQLSAFGSQESDLAAKLSKKISVLKSKEKLIDQLAVQEEQESNPEALEQIRFRQGLAYLSTNQTEKAKYIFLELAKSKNKALRDKSKFYLGWVYKLNNEYGKSADVFMKLLEDPKLKTDFELGLRAQLADIYYKTGNVNQSLSQYQALSDKVKQGQVASKKNAKDAWLSFSELEQANIYYFDKKDMKRAKAHLNAFGVEAKNLNIDDLEYRLEKSSQANLRDLAFQALVSGKDTSRALALFLKHLDRFPNDYLALAGTATVYILLGDLNQALDYARRAYQNNSSEYTTSLLGYVYGLRGEFDNAIKKYKEVLDERPDSFAAKFNMAYMFLSVRHFKEALELLTDVEKQLSGDEGRKFIQAKTLNNLGYTYWRLGDLKKAEEKFKLSLKISPDLGVAQQNLNRLAAGITPQATTLEA
jgi:tetratricopeptide (TPR) repeat protein